ncbi:hypothetical protein M408DRAFT_247692 [Serendipita vermifera MAFF 305830]|uniref:rRNA-processing protein FYV7 n=1 Tax=Serendipita vermifera MAFF 305830 TaxID=933852 RepID=A0A0C2WC12_SERVB|nr:hypothetical protein M408DRAFT_247692 [Serendipita vermifera MAFF 305830]
MSNPALKPRKKPQFAHLYPTQAAKAKQAWVNKVKVRSKWAKEKRKGVAVADKQWQATNEDEEGREQTATPVSGPSRKRKRSLDAEDGRQLRVNKHPANSPSTQADDRERRERVRELSRKAYAPESLHTFKSNTSHRQRGRDGARPTAPGTKGGQPNMKLRMNALLEKIKLNAGAP